MEIDLSGSDWIAWFQPVAQALPAFSNFHYPPWFLVFIYPLSLLPGWVDYLVLAALSVFVVLRYGGWKAVLMLVAAPTMVTIAYGNVDVLLIAVFMVPFWLQIILISCKPMLFTRWLLRKALSNSILNYVPFVLLVLCSFVVWGWWPARMTTSGVALSSTISPTIFLPGVLCLLSKSPVMWLLGAGLLSPYIQLYHFTHLVALYIKRNVWWKGLILVIVSWVVILYGRG